MLCKGLTNLSSCLKVHPSAALPKPVPNLG
ncbi:hypothetical protein A2U01_0059504, partial [Trifolium medium]|nr:hypothetical protein [Trifolium medium]